MDNQQLTANIIVLTTAISALLTLFRPDQHAAFVAEFKNRIHMIQEHSLAKPIPDEWLDAIDHEAKAFFAQLFPPVV